MQACPGWVGRVSFVWAARSVVDLRETLGGHERERAVLGDLGGNGAGGPAKPFDRNVPACASGRSGATFRSMLERSLVAGSMVSRMPGVPCRGRSRSTGASAGPAAFGVLAPAGWTEPPI